MKIKTFIRKLIYIFYNFENKYSLYKNSERKKKLAVAKFNCIFYISVSFLCLYYSIFPNRTNFIVICIMIIELLSIIGIAVFLNNLFKMKASPQKK